MRNIPEKYKNKLKEWEGLRLTAYQDEAGVWTIGYGHTGPEVVRGMRITQAQANRYFEEDLEEAIVAVDNLVTPELSDVQYFVLASFVFNVGINAFRRSSLLKRLNAGDLEAVPGELIKWNKITDHVTKKKKVSPGLVNRRAAEVAMWTSVTSAPSIVAAEPDSRVSFRKPEVQGPTLLAGSAVGEQLTDTATQISVFAEYSEYIRLAFMLLMFAGVGLTIYGLVKRSKEE